MNFIPYPHTRILITCFPHHTHFILGFFYGTSSFSSSSEFLSSSFIFLRNVMTDWSGWIKCIYISMYQLVSEKCIFPLIIFHRACDKQLQKERPMTDAGLMIRGLRVDFITWYGQKYDVSWMMGIVRKVARARGSDFWARPFVHLLLEFSSSSSLLSSWLPSPTSFLQPFPFHLSQLILLLMSQEKHLFRPGTQSLLLSFHTLLSFSAFNMLWEINKLWSCSFFSRHIISFWVWGVPFSSLSWWKKLLPLSGRMAYFMESVMMALGPLYVFVSARDNH